MAPKRWNHRAVQPASAVNADTIKAIRERTGNTMMAPPPGRDAAKDSAPDANAAWPKFSVLMAYYHGDDPDQLEQAIASVRRQTLPPDEIVLVRDGRVGPALQQAVSRCEQAVGSLLVHVPLEKNAGAGPAWNEGMKHCRHELIARMDADDVSRPHRFATLVPLIAGDASLDLVGGGINENGQLRPVKLTPAEIRRDARFRNPINHVTVVFRKSAVQDAGGYQDFVGFADYYLWIRMLRNGCRFANVDNVVVDVRAGGAAWCQRRSGWGYIRREIYLQWLMLQWGLIGPHHFLYNAASRTTFRLLPLGAKDWLYRRLLRSKATVAPNPAAPLPRRTEETQRPRRAA